MVLLMLGRVCLGLCVALPQLVEFPRCTLSQAQTVADACERFELGRGTPWDYRVCRDLAGWCIRTCCGPYPRMSRPEEEPSVHPGAVGPLCGEPNEWQSPFARFPRAAHESATWHGHDHRGPLGRVPTSCAPFAQPEISPLTNP